jgi:Fe2+ transport system protein FeoA
MTTLKTLAVGVRAVIAGVANIESGARLQSMGFRPGSHIVVLRDKAGCRHVRVGSTEYAIRNATADLIELNTLYEDKPS